MDMPFPQSQWSGLQDLNGPSVHGTRLPLFLPEIHSGARIDYGIGTGSGK